MKPESEASERQNGDKGAGDKASQSTENIAPSTSSHDGGQSTLSTAAASAKQIAGDVAQGVKTAVGDAMAWAEAKADKLAAKEEHGVGPYGSVATCAPSDLDVISTGVLPAMPSPDKEPDVKTDGP